MEHRWIPLLGAALLACGIGSASALAAESGKTPAAPGAAPAAKPSSAPVEKAEPPAKPATPGTVEQLERVRAEQMGSDKDAIAAQQRVDQLDDERQKMLAEYRKALADTESHEAYADQLGRQIQSQNEELADIQHQLDQIETTSRSIVPLEKKMLETLKEFVRLDIPFLVEERSARVATLEAMLDRADVSISEKYRRIVEAYQVEMDYGRTTESYEGKLVAASAPAGAEPRTVRFLRIGRVSLLYQTMDGAETGYWDATAHRWIRDDGYAHSFKQGVAVAQKRSAPEMLIAPVPAPVEARS